MGTVKEKYGYLPISVWNIKKRSSLRKLVGEQHGSLPTRRSENAKYLPGLKQSSFNPDLAKRIIEYWSEPGDTIVDPFAGHSTRMVVSQMCGRNYIAFEVGPQSHQHLLDSLKERQLTLFDNSSKVEVYLEDGCLMKSLPDESADFIFTCPPFWNIETYEDVPGELSHCKTYDQFLDRIQVASNNCYRILKPGKYMAWVVADFRKGGLKLFHRDVLNLFEFSGFKLWDIVINVLHSPFASQQIGKCEKHKYTSKSHEYVLVVKKE